MAIAGLSSRHIRTCCETPESLTRDRYAEDTRGGSRGGVCRTRERFVAIVESEEQLAEIAAMAGMASGDVGGRDRRETFRGEGGHQLLGELQTRAACEKVSAGLSEHAM